MPRQIKRAARRTARKLVDPIGAGIKSEVENRFRSAANPHTDGCASARLPDGKDAQRRSRIGLAITLTAWIDLLTGRDPPGVADITAVPSRENPVIDDIGVHDDFDKYLV